MDGEAAGDGGERKGGRDSGQSRGCDEDDQRCAGGGSVAGVGAVEYAVADGAHGRRGGCDRGGECADDSAVLGAARSGDQAWRKRRRAVGGLYAEIRRWFLRSDVSFWAE